MPEQGGDSVGTVLMDQGGQLERPRPPVGPDHAFHPLVHVADVVEESDRQSLREDTGRRGTAHKRQRPLAARR
jgi:hypothetical protein